MQGPFERTTDIVIPTGRGGFCCILPCALLVTLSMLSASGALLLVRHIVRQRRARISEKTVWEKAQL